MSLPFDRMHLSSFTGGDMDLEQALLLDFHKNALVHIENLQAALGVQGWNECAHRFKGAASGIGMRTLASICQKAEDMDVLETAQGTDLIAAMRAELAHLTQYLKL